MSRSLHDAKTFARGERENGDSYNDYFSVPDCNFRLQ
jgi:hypothetical protein